MVLGVDCERSQGVWLLLIRILRLVLLAQLIRDYCKGMTFITTNGTAFAIHCILEKACSRPIHSNV